MLAQVALTEYSWGADGDMNGATAQADILGILGREGVDMAARWTCPDKSTPTYQVSRVDPGGKEPTRPLSICE